MKSQVIIPEWWRKLPDSVVGKFRYYVDVAIEAGKPTAILAHPEGELLYIAAVSESGVMLARGMAKNVSEKYGQPVEVIVITPDNYGDWFNEVM